MANRLSDDELRKALQDLGEDVGPITPTTRSTWERKLGSLRRARGPSKNSSSSGPLNAFSSDDSEIENASSGATRRKRTYNTRADSERLSLTAARPDSDIFKKPIHIPALSQEKSRARGRRSKRNAGATFDVETSDSDFDSDNTFSRVPRLRRKPLPVPREDSPVLQRKSLNSSSSWNSEHQFSPVFDTLKREYQSNGYLSSPNGDFVEEKGLSTNYSHCVSWLLVVGVFVFFALIGALYMTEVQKTSQMADRNYSKFCVGVREEELCTPLIQMSKELHHLLATHAGEYECGGVKKRNLSVSNARAIMKDVLATDSTFQMEYFDVVFNLSVSLFKNNPALGVKYEESALEGVQGLKSLWCRLRLSLHWTATKLLMLLGVCFLLLVLYSGVVFWKKRREGQEKLFYEMVEKVIDILQDPGECGDPSVGCCKAVVNVRDALIPAKERKEKLWLWERVVTFIEENESRVSVEFRTINGEDFKVWRWHPGPTTENESGKQGKVWQGQAFSSLGKSKNAYTPTPCLKIRNMFDPEVEYGDEWQVSVRDAILEKCEGNDGIRHIAFDTATNNEGCVYMMCGTEEAAGKAYNDLHGWWFDGKLVTVKYLKKVRYLQRFPDAELCSEPLRPSNNKRLSLSTPFFSSVLERS